jgi:hypothetical protein
MFVLCLYIVYVMSVCSYVYALSPYYISRAQRHCSRTCCLLRKYNFPLPPYCYVQVSYYLSKRYLFFENLGAINAASVAPSHKFAFSIVTTFNSAGAVRCDALPGRCSQVRRSALSVRFFIRAKTDSWKRASKCPNNSGAF